MNARAWLAVMGRRRTRATIAEVARALGVHHTAVRRWIARGWLTARQEWDWSADHRGRTPRGPLRVRWQAVRKALRVPEVAAAVGRAMMRASKPRAKP